MSRHRTELTPSAAKELALRQGTAHVLGAGRLPDVVGAVLFDQDDTLVSSEGAWDAAAARLWLESGSCPGAGLEPGCSLSDVVDSFLVEHPLADAQATGRRLLALLLEELGRSVAPMPGASALLTRLSLRLPLAVCSNSPSAVVRSVMQGLGWLPLLSGALGTEDVERPKPAPDLYREGARRCGRRVQDCVVFEDSVVGARAARDAGAFVVTVGDRALGHGDAAVTALTDELVTTWSPRPTEGGR